MERWIERLNSAEKALATLVEAVERPAPDTFIRDAAIHRFEYTFEAIWKAAQSYLVDVQGLACNSPRSTLRALGQVGILDDADTAAALTMLDDRNMMTHTYFEVLAVSIFHRLPSHAAILTRIVTGLRARIG